MRVRDPFGPVGVKEPDPFDAVMPGDGKLTPSKIDPRTLTHDQIYFNEVDKDGSICKYKIESGVRVKVADLGKIKDYFNQAIMKASIMTPEDLECLDFSSIVAQVDDTQITLINGLVIPLDNIQVEGEIEPGSLIILGVCVEDDGAIVFVNIILVYQLDPDVVLLPVPIPVEPEQPPSDGGDETICHKPGTPAEKTMTVPQSALQSHLEHGDTIGPCE